MFLFSSLLLIPIVGEKLITRQTTTSYCYDYWYQKCYPHCPLQDFFLVTIFNLLLAESEQRYHFLQKHKNDSHPNILQVRFFVCFLLLFLFYFVSFLFITASSHVVSFFQFCWSMQSKRLWWFTTTTATNIFLVVLNIFNAIRLPQAAV